MTFDPCTAADVASCDLDGSAKNLRIILETMEKELFYIKKSGVFLGPGFLLDCCEAMSAAIRGLDYIADDLRAAVTQEHQKRKEGLEHEQL